MKNSEFHASHLAADVPKMGKRTVSGIAARNRAMVELAKVDKVRPMMTTRGEYRYA